MHVLERLQKPTPRLFQHLRNLGLVLASVGGVFLASPVLLPVQLVQWGGYLVVAGGVLTAVSQLTVDDSAVHTTDSAG